VRARVSSSKRSGFIRFTCFSDIVGGRVASPGLEGGPVAVLHLHMGPFPRNRCNIVLMADEFPMNFEGVGPFFRYF